MMPEVSLWISLGMFLLQEIQVKAFGSLQCNFGDQDMFLVVKFNQNGSKLWSKQLGTLYYDSGMDLSTDSLGNIFVGGVTKYGLDSYTPSGNEDLFLVKYDSSGTKQWLKQFGTNITDFTEGVSIDRRGDIYLAGYTNGALEGKTNSGDNDVIIFKYSSGIPSIKLETGDIDNFAHYRSGTGTNSLVFNYTVQEGDITSDLDYVSTTSLEINSGSIKNTPGSDAVLTLPSPGLTGSTSYDKSLVIDGVRPKVLSVSSTN